MVLRGVLFPPLLQVLVHVFRVRLAELFHELDPFDVGFLEEEGFLALFNPFVLLLAPFSLDPLPFFFRFLGLQFRLLYDESRLRNGTPRDLHFLASPCRSTNFPASSAPRSFSPLISSASTLPYPAFEGRKRNRMIS